MAKPKDKLNELIESMNEIELSEILDFAEFISEKRKKMFDRAFDNVQEVGEDLTEEELKELKEASSSNSISYKEMWQEK